MEQQNASTTPVFTPLTKPCFFLRFFLIACLLKTFCVDFFGDPKNLQVGLQWQGASGILLQPPVT